MQLYFIRHAQSENNRLWAETGSSEGRQPDPALTDLGHRQAQLLAEYLAYLDRDVSADDDMHNHRGFDITHLYSSLMLRSVTTGHYISELLDLPLLGLEMIHEHGGIYETNLDTGEKIGLPGGSRSALVADYPRLVWPDGSDESGWWGSRPAETWEEVPQRAQAFLDFLLAEHEESDDRVAVVSHGGFFDALMYVLLNYERQNERLNGTREVGFFVNNSSISRFQFEKSRIGLVYLNRVDHLEAGLVS